MAPIISVLGFSKGYGSGNKRTPPIIQNTITFTNGVSIGYSGPLLHQSRDGITASFPNNSWILDYSQYNASNGIQYWTVPQTGTYRIQVFGADGGYGGFNQGSGSGRGAVLRGDFNLTEGDVLKILVGQVGTNTEITTFESRYAGRGGGGGTFVTTPTNTALIVAGGGGGASASVLADGIASTSIHASLNTWGHDGQEILSPPQRSGGGGVNGGGGGAGAGRYVGAGGGGMSGYGGDADYYPFPSGIYYPNGWGAGGDGVDGSPHSGNPIEPTTGGNSYNSGGLGGIRPPNANPAYGHPGGFGGGGASSEGNSAGGGGGGYSGGGGGTVIPAGNFHGGGGGSYNSGTNQFNFVPQTTTGGLPLHGKVVITFLFSYEYPAYDPPPPAVSTVFSSDFWSGDGSGVSTVNNGIDLLNNGGLVWIKDRVNGVLSSYWHSHFLTSSEKSGSLSSNNKNYADNSPAGFLSTGYQKNSHNQTGGQYVGYTFRRAPKFFDTLVYAGTDGSQTIKHSLRSTPGCIIIKNLTDTTSWVVMHYDGSNYRILYLNTTNQVNFESSSFTGMPLITNWNSDTFTVSTFTSYDPGTGGVGDVQYSTNRKGNKYAAYIFASDSDSSGIIKCGSWSGSTTVNLGWEPQWILFKKHTALTTSDWYIHDYRLNTSGSSSAIRPNTNSTESTISLMTKTGTGFSTNTTDDWIYIAVRCGAGSCLF